MHFSQSNEGGGPKAGKFALVAAVHVLVGVLFVHSLDTRTISLPKLPEQVLVLIQPDIPKPPPPPEPPKRVPKAAPPQLVVPKVEVAVPPPEQTPPLQATTEPDPAPPAPSQVESDAPPAPSSQNTGAMRTAVLADADGCAKPDYPASAARDGTTGTVTLALLVGPDGMVQNSRVQHSSGSRDLDRAAVRALSLCKFKPAMNNGVPEAGWAQLAYVWTLE